LSERIEKGIANHIRLVDGLKDQAGLLQAIARRIIDILAHDGRVYTLGNGGSAADAQHIAAELVGRFRCDRKALPAVAMTTDTSALLSIGNDYGFEQVFARQVEALAGSKDLVWALSTSGRSSNVLAAMQVAREKRACVIGFTGGHGQGFDTLCDLCLHVDHDTADRIQEIHQLAYHLVCEAVEAHFARR
jgi:D-sedoheptulose 7-phosphate isomerase